MKREAFVRASFNYTRDDGAVPEVYFYEPDVPVTPNAPGNDPLEMSVLDGWSRVDSFSLDREGFELQEFAHVFGQWEDDAAIRSQFYPQVTEFIRRNVGAQRVHIFDHTIRSKLNEQKQTAEDSTTQRAPVRLVHCDFTPISGPLRVRQILPDEADGLLQRRVAFYNFWLPLMHRVEEMPLAMCDATSSVEADLIKMYLRYRDRTGEIFVMRHSDAHRWWYFPLMEPKHVLLLKTYDSEVDGRARFMGHSAFIDPNTAPDARTRASIEIRTMAFF
ncbi:MAG: CmcJ/NvfI family oxidoreductase [Betaproteobacteria bacterium]